MVRFGLSGVSARTPRNCGHSFEAHWATWPVLVAHTDTDGESRTVANMDTQLLAEVFKVNAAVDAPDIQKHFID
jgi:hypothetical protein